MITAAGGRRRSRQGVGSIGVRTCLVGKCPQGAWQLADDLVVVSEVQVVTLLANRRFDLRCRYPWLSLADANLGWCVAPARPMLGMPKRESPCLAAHGRLSGLPEVLHVTGGQPR